MSVYTNVDLNVSDCHFWDCFRGALVVTVGHPKLDSPYPTLGGGTWSTDKDLGVDGGVRPLINGMEVHTLTAQMSRDPWPA